ncbi:hypothetical protein M404DRAFT_997658 [Pisolithus tinctorius Marx 270]|uniref:Uncharacterized protein n=1 Tax=Pisolithus tinctorius Marx 270 TaxID=870435 RepID=A0A0C3PIP6_PISTI|nr:hypothetical protein M404DRAFT_997658 [Pisolithus tinctorius Marx 270]
MQFPLSLPLPHRQFDLRARLFGAKGTAQPRKRPIPADDGADSSNEHENATKQKPYVFLVTDIGGIRDSAYSRCRGLKATCKQAWSSRHLQFLS